MRVPCYIVDASSMLNEARVGSSTEATWAVVLDFLETKLAPAQ